MAPQGVPCRGSNEKTCAFGLEYTESSAPVPGAQPHPVTPPGRACHAEPPAARRVDEHVPHPRSCSNPPSPQATVSPISAPLRLGNDVVDLAHPRVRSRRRRARFLARVLSSPERRWLASDPQEEEARLWAAWAAKETAYKVVCKWPGDRPVFAHARFVTELELGPADADLREVRGTVRALDRSVEVSGWVSGSFVHLVGTAGDRPATWARHRIELGVERVPETTEDGELLELDGLRDRFTSREWSGIHGLPSAWARLEARRRLASHLATETAATLPERAGDDEGPGPGRSFEPRIEILTSRTRPGRTPPRVLVDGQLLEGVDLSISHHGAWVGWALLLPPAHHGPEPDTGRD
ncbi:MAG: 4'-phosphopantetheinyl transferase superfamily protein [Gemmatimonadales bacterium]|nr:MAG: 4'-phosphopantetheinyl transferase superfamily protein [Gemmatimonadales bacterium]